MVFSISLIRDYSSIRLVSQQWARLWRAVRQWRHDQFNRNFSSSDRPVSIHWQRCEPPKRFNLTPRFSHSACYVDSKRSLYVFGGRRDLTTSLNDFWRLDLSTRRFETNGVKKTFSDAVFGFFQLGKSSRHRSLSAAEMFVELCRR